MVEYLEAHPSAIHIRNRALILLDYFCAFRRSEIVSLSWDQVNFVADGIVIEFMISKTDQTVQGAVCIIPFRDDYRCPVRELIDWGKASHQLHGSLSRQISNRALFSKIPFAQGKLIGLLSKWLVMQRSSMPIK
jgi:integrase